MTKTAIKKGESCSAPAKMTKISVGKREREQQIWLRNGFSTMAIQFHEKLTYVCYAKKLEKCKQYIEIK